MKALLKRQRMTVETFAAEVERALGPRLVSLVLYGSAASGTQVPKRSDVNTLLLCCDAADDALFAALEPAVRRWMRAGHPAPIILTEREWRESADAFAIEYEDIRQAHRLLAGRDPWPGVTVRREDVLRQLEQELLGKLVRLRQACVALRHDPKRLAEVLVRSAGGFFTMLRAALRLAGTSVPRDSEELVRAAASVIGFSPDGLADLVAHVRGRRALKLKPGDPRAAAYLAAVVRTAEYVNGLT